MSETEDSPRRPGVLRLRYTPTSLVALGFATICAVPLIVAAWPWGLVALVIPALVIFYVLRTGADITPDQIVIRGPFYQRPVPLSDLAGLAVSAKGGVFLVKSDGASILIPTARARDLPRLRGLLFPTVHEDPEDLAEPVDPVEPVEPLGQ